MQALIDLFFSKAELLYFRIKIAVLHLVHEHVDYPRRYDLINLYELR